MKTYRIHDEIGRLSIEIKVDGSGTIRVYQLIQDGEWRGHWRDYEINDKGGMGCGMMLQAASGSFGLFPESPNV